MPSLAFIQSDQAVDEISKLSFNLKGPRALLFIGGSCSPQDNFGPNRGVKLSIFNEAKGFLREIGQVKMIINNPGTTALPAAFFVMNARGQGNIPPGDYSLKIEPILANTTKIEKDNRFYVLILDEFPL